MIEADKMISIEKFLLFTSIVLLITWFLCNILKIWCNSLRNDVKYDVGIPPFGSHWREILNIESWQETLHRLYYKYPNERFVVLSGIGGRPEYLIRSPELVKQIAIGDFSSFVNRNSGIHATTDPILGNALTNLTTNDWRRVRNVLTPLLCGKRLKQIVIPSLDENKRDLVQFVCDECKKISTNELIVDMMDLSTRSAVDAFCLTAFGLKTDSLRSAGRDYGFFATAQSYIANGPSAVSAAMYWAITSFPFTMKLLFGKTLMPKSDQDFFQKSCRDIADNRIANQINRFDYVNLLQILRDANKNGDNNSISMIRAFIQFERKKFRQNNRLAIIYLNRFSNRMFFPLVDCNDVEMISQCFEFYESVITENNLIMTFIAQRLAEQPDIQQRLYTEMNEMKGRIGDKHLTYDDVAGMKYADMVIKEGLIATRQFHFHFILMRHRKSCL